VTGDQTLPQPEPPELTRTAVDPYSDVSPIDGTLLLSFPSWLPKSPLKLGEVRLSRDAGAPVAATVGSEPESEHVRPLWADGRHFATYAEASPPWTGPACSRTGAHTGLSGSTWRSATA
jgi:hypothetical protein